MAEHPGRDVKFPASLRALHWSMAVLVAALLGIGMYMADLPMDAPDKLDLYPWHRAFGVLAFVLVIVRLAVRLNAEVPALPGGLKWYERRAAQICQIIFYVTLLVMPPLGYIATSALPDFPGMPAPTSVWFFGLDLPVLPLAKNYDMTKVFITLHSIAGHVMLAAIVMHVIGSLKHRFLDKPENDVLKQMM